MGAPGRLLVEECNTGCVKVQVLGSVTIDGEPLTAAHERVILAILVAFHGRAVGRDRLMHALWGDELPKSATVSLQSKISRLRRRLPENSLSSLPGGYQLDVPHEGSIDAIAFEQLATQVATAPASRAIELCDAALHLWRGRALRDIADLSIGVREATRLEDLRLEVLERRAEALLRTGRHSEAIASAAAIADHSPFRESAWIVQARALSAAGRSVEGLRVLHDYRELLADVTGLDPSHLIAEVEGELLNGGHEASASIRSSSPNGSGQNSPPGSGAAPVKGAQQKLISRHAEMASLVGLTDWVRGGSAADGARRVRTVVVTGPFGVGKTFLVSHALEGLDHAGVAAFVGECSEQGRAPLLPVRSIISALARRQGLAEWSLSDDDEKQRHRLTAQAVQIVLGGGPLVLVVEDAQWADSATMQLLAMLNASPTPSSAPILVIVTHRLGSEGNEAELASLRRDVGVETLELSAFDEASMSELARATLGGDVQPRLARDLQRVSGGNPLLALTILRELEADDRLVRTSGGIGSEGPVETHAPADIVAGVRRRLTRLPEETRRLLEQAAVLDETPSVDLLALLTDRPVRGTLEDLGAAEQDGIVRIRNGRVRWEHAALRHGVAATVPEGVRQDIHERVIRRLPNIDRPEARRVLARHIADRGVPEGLEDDSLSATLIAAGRQALGRGDAGLANDVLAASIRIVDMPSVEQLRLAGLAAFRDHDPVVGEELLRRAVERARAVGDIEAWGAALIDHSRLVLTLSVSDIDRLALEDWASAADGRFPALHARLLGVQAEAETTSGDAASSRALAIEAIAQARRSMDPLIEAEALFASGLADYGRLQLDDAQTQFEASWQLAEEAADPWTAAWGAVRSCLVALLRSDHEQFWRAYETGRRFVEPTNIWSEGSLLEAAAAHVACREGDLASARVHGESSLQRMRRSNYHYTAELLCPVLIHLAREEQDERQACEVWRDWPGRSVLRQLHGARLGLHDLPALRPFRSPISLRTLPLIAEIAAMVGQGEPVPGADRERLALLLQEALGAGVRSAPGCVAELSALLDQLSQTTKGP